MDYIIGPAGDGIDRASDAGSWPHIALLGLVLFSATGQCKLLLHHSSRGCAVMPTPNLRYGLRCSALRAHSRPLWLSSAEKLFQGGSFLQSAHSLKPSMCNRQALAKAAAMRKRLWGPCSLRKPADRQEVWHCSGKSPLARASGERARLKLADSTSTTLSLPV